MSLWQEITDQFYPEREGFTASRSLGEEFADHLITSFPVLMRRELGNLISAMLRPAGQEWFRISVAEEDDLTNEDKRWLEYATKVQRRAMYDPVAQMVTATKQGDHDYVTYGQCVLTSELNRFGNALLHRAWHLKDVAWMDGYDGRPSCVHHNWKLPGRDVEKLFPGKLHPEWVKKIQHDPYCDLAGRRIVIESEDYGRKFRHRFTSIWIDTENNHILEERGANVTPYIIPRWHKPSHSQYGYSLSTMLALPEARTLQAMALTLLDAGEMAVQPPIIAKTGLFREDFNRYPGGLTYADLQGEGRLSDAMEYLNPDKSGIPFGIEMRDDQKEILASLFFINKINLPVPDREMTAYEASLRNQEFIRNTMPLFEPIEEYNAQLCETDFDILMHGNAFGPIQNIPPSLMGRDVKFRFESPLQDSMEREKAGRFGEMLQLLGSAAELDQGAMANVDIIEAVRDAIEGLKVPAKWLNAEEVVKSIIAQQAELQNEQVNLQRDRMIAQADQGRAVADMASAEAEAVE